jgi:hypothetical protein
LHDLACVVHVHSTFSDGRATVAEILDAARASRADAVLLTDHDTLEARRRGLEGWHDGVLLLVGLEVSPRGGHFLAFGVGEEIDHAGLDERAIAGAVADAGALGFAAHPFSRGSRMSTRIGHPHPWEALDAPGVTGVELWSVMTEAAEAWRSPREMLRFVRWPERELTGPPAENLREWDRICTRRRCVGIGGVDAHASGLRLAGRALTPFPHRRVFRFLRTHVLLDRAPSGRLEDDRHAVYTALGRGRCYVAMDWLADPRGFSFAADGVEMGGETEARRMTLGASAPRDCRLLLLRDGVELARADAARELALEVELPGAYRAQAELEADGRRRTWIVSNPVYLRGQRGAEAPAEGDAEPPERERQQ